MSLALRKFGILALIAIGLASGCGKDDANDPNGGDGTSGGGVNRSTVKRSFQSINGMEFSYFFVAFDPNDANATITDVTVKIPTESTAQNLTSSSIVGRVDTKTMATLVLDTDPTTDQKLKADVLRDFSGQLFVYTPGISENLATGESKFSITFTSNGQSKTFNVQTKGR